MRDIVTGFSGTVTAYAQYISGCDQLCLVPKAKKGADSCPNGVYYDINRLEYAGKAKHKIVLDVEEVRGAGTPPNNNK